MLKIFAKKRLEKRKESEHKLENELVIENYNKKIMREYSKGNYEEVLKVLWELDKLMPNHKEILTAIGYTYFLKTDYQNASTYFSQALLGLEEPRLKLEITCYLQFNLEKYIRACESNIMFDKFQQDNIKHKSLRAVNISELWNPDYSTYIEENYICDAITDIDVKRVEDKYGYKLPKMYIDLLKQQNGGILKKESYYVEYKNTDQAFWAMIGPIYPLGHYNFKNLKKWGYPFIGIPFCEAPSGGYDQIFLDYRKNGVNGEPQVSHVDSENGYRITILADTFSEFVTNLEKEREVDAGSLI